MTAPTTTCQGCGDPAVRVNGLCLACELAAAAKENRRPRISGRVASPPVVPPPTQTFSLASLIAFVTFICIALAVGRWHIGLGVLFVITLGPPCLRISLAADRARAAGGPLSRSQKIEIFKPTLGIIVLALIVLSCMAAALLAPAMFGI